MIILTAITSIAIFIFAFWRLGVAKVGADVLATAQNAVATMRDDSLDDDTREKKLQQASIKLFMAFISILIRSALAILASLLPILLADLTGLSKIEDVTSFLSRWDVIVIVTVSVIVFYLIFIRSQPYSNDAFHVNYSRLDRILHRVAFSSISIQHTAADIEKMAFGGFYRDVVADKPIFITSLPRAGTTLMLEVLHKFPSLATHTYRDMPFVMSPILWSRLSSGFKKDDELRGRAHGDGMQVGYDSPEAFEEILWRTFWPEKYSKTGIELWEARDFKEEAHVFFMEHMKKIIALRRPGMKEKGRYLSKNNGNIARVDLIGRMFPGSKILVPIRHPMEHAASLLRQHRNFMHIQKNDTFIRRYMADIGHYEFGELHRPILFPALDELIADRNPLTIDYWLGYWIAGFEYILERRDEIILISYEATCLDGKNALSKICAQLDISEDGMLNTAASIFKIPSQKYCEKVGTDNQLRKRAEKLHKALIMS